MPILVIFSCAAGSSIWQYLLVLSGTLASGATIGRHEVRLLTLTAPLFLALTSSTLLLLAWARRLARIPAMLVSPSAALVLC